MTTAPTCDDDATARSLSLSQLTAPIWGFFALVITIAALAGFIVGTNHGMNKAAGASGGATQHTSAAAPPTGSDSAAPAARSFEDIAASLPPGRGPSRPQPGADGLFDAMIHGGSGPVKTQDEVMNIHRRNPADPFAIGPVDAPVVISEFSDFECPFCSLFANGTEKEIMARYVDTGYVRLEFNDLPINGSHAVAAAKAGRAAAEQGKFHEFSDALFSASREVRGHPGYEMDDFVRFAQQAGVPDIAKFTADASGTKYDDAVRSAQRYASGLGINGTPAFIIGDQYVSGAQPTEVFLEVIDEQLAKVADNAAN